MIGFLSIVIGAVVLVIERGSVGAIALAGLLLVLLLAVAARR